MAFLMLPLALSELTVCLLVVEAFTFLTFRFLDAQDDFLGALGIWGIAEVREGEGGGVQDSRHGKEYEDDSGQQYFLDILGYVPSFK